MRNTILRTILSNALSDDNLKSLIPLVTKVAWEAVTNNIVFKNDALQSKLDRLVSSDQFSALIHKMVTEMLRGSHRVSEDVEDLSPGSPLVDEKNISTIDDDIVLPDYFRG